VGCRPDRTVWLVVLSPCMILPLMVINSIELWWEHIQALCRRVISGECVVLDHKSRDTLGIAPKYSAQTNVL